MEDETAYHAVMECTKARGLRQRMRQDWNLPEDSALGDIGENWALIVLDSVDALTKQRLLFLRWRAWHLRNDSIFGTGTASIEESVRFICSYSSAMENLKCNDSVLLGCFDVTDGSKSVLASTSVAEDGERGHPRDEGSSCSHSTDTWFPPEHSW